MSATPALPHNVTLTVPFPSTHLASIAQKVLSVDRELKPNECRKAFTVREGNSPDSQAELIVTIDAISARVLRTSVSSIFDFLALVVETMEAFGDQDASV
ncbi:CTAG/Pcc1 family [Fimicolochytrium jonesii]|uniref:CTAG/Pcc1 family n=1 Tax=Fimicolochytrium jonesii TaxID=1396493 RepID=UPI0022FE5FFA|nr:CTAG/Pcc1 family [Fimicolochytrium jonesii]KAI8825740.1 CTAG/Pcc1 family [Fimicolochytrium jonesii]